MQRIDRHDRETFIAALLKAVPTATREHALKLLRWGATYGRLAEAQCNGDYPAENGERTTEVCAHHGSAWVPSAFTHRRGYQAACYRCDWRGPECALKSSALGSQNYHNEPGHEDSMSIEALAECPDCRAERIIRETCFDMGVTGDNLESLEWVTPDFQGDPRGHTVRLQIAGAPLDAYERPALAIPTS